MERNPLKEFLIREIRVQTIIADGIKGGDRWTRNHDGIDEDVTAVALADAEQRIAEAQEHLARLDGKA